MKDHLNYYKKINTAVTVSVDDISKTKLAEQRFNFYFQNKIIPMDLKKKSILEFGAGTGYNAFYLLTKCDIKDISLIEKNPSSLKNLKKNLDNFKNVRIKDIDIFKYKPKKKYDLGGEIANTGKINEIILEQVEEYFLNRFNINKLSLDTKDFDISFARGLSLEDGATTLTDFTSCILSSEINNYLSNKKISKCKIFVSGGGRKNSLLINKIKKRISKNFSINLIEELGFNGDFIV